jgi:hypothetical protein
MPAGLETDVKISRGTVVSTWVWTCFLALVPGRAPPWAPVCPAAAEPLPATHDGERLGAVPSSDSVLAVLEQRKETCRFLRRDPVAPKEVLIADLPGRCPDVLDINATGQVALMQGNGPARRVDLRSGEVVPVSPAPFGDLQWIGFDAAGDLITAGFEPTPTRDGGAPASRKQNGENEDAEDGRPGLVHVYTSPDGRTWRQISVSPVPAKDRSDDGIIGHSSLDYPRTSDDIHDPKLIRKLNALAGEPDAECRWSLLRGTSPGAPRVYVREDTSGDGGAPDTAIVDHDGRLKPLLTIVLNLTARGDFLLGGEPQQLWDVRTAKIVSTAKKNERLRFWPLPARPRK